MAKKKAGKAKQGAENDPNQIDFETALAEIEQIVALLESGELGLSESLEKYESGIRQLKQCHALLDAAEQRVSLLSGFDADGNPITEPLEPIEPSAGKRKGAPSGESSQSRETDTGVDDSPGLF